MFQGHWGDGKKKLRFRNECITVCTACSLRMKNCYVVCDRPLILNSFNLETFYKIEERLLSFKKIKA